MNVSSTSGPENPKSIFLLFLSPQFLSNQTNNKNENADRKRGREKERELQHRLYLPGMSDER